MERLTSRKNPQIQRFRALGTERETRRQCGEYLCEGRKLLREALLAGAEITGILWSGEPDILLGAGIPAYQAPGELLQYASAMEHSPGPLFSVKMPLQRELTPPSGVLVLESLQDPGNVGTVLRTAAAFSAELVVLCEHCADPYNPKAVRASMGAVFRQRFLELSRAELLQALARWALPLYAAALDETARDIRTLSLRHCAVAVGNEGNGLSPELLAHSEEKIIIPMAEESESLNAAMAAGVILWEMRRAGK